MRIINANSMSFMPAGMLGSEWEVISAMLAEAEYRHICGKYPIPAGVVVEVPVGIQVVIEDGYAGDTWTVTLNPGDRVQGTTQSAWPNPGRCPTIVRVSRSEPITSPQAFAASDAISAEMVEMFAWSNLWNAWGLNVAPTLEEFVAALGIQLDAEGWVEGDLNLTNRKARPGCVPWEPFVDAFSCFDEPAFVRAKFLNDLEALPKGLKVRGALYVGPSVTTLPEGLEVGTTLCLQEAKSLATLPAGVKVGQDILVSTVYSCGRMLQLPQDTQLGGYFGCPYARPRTA